MACQVCSLRDVWVNMCVAYCVYFAMLCLIRVLFSGCVVYQLRRCPEVYSLCVCTCCGSGVFSGSGVSIYSSPGMCV